jgi:hypothetical protein
MDQLYPRALGSLYVAFYDSQGYGGGILTRLYTGYLEGHIPFLSCLQHIGTDRTENMFLNCYAIIALHMSRWGMR